MLAQAINVHAHLDVLPHLQINAHGPSLMLPCQRGMLTSGPAHHTADQTYLAYEQQASAPQAGPPPNAPFVRTCNRTAAAAATCAAAMVPTAPVAAAACCALSGVVASRSVTTSW